MEQIPFVAHEADMTRMERTNRRVWILCIILIIALLGTNLGWFWYENQFEYEETTTEVTQELNAEGGDAIINDGVHIYDEGKADNQNYN